MSPAAVFVLLGVAVGAYVLTAGADFGGGVWDLLARGPRAQAQRDAISRAIAPIWEVNHIWMIFVVVMLFTVFPDAFAVVSVALHVPMLLVLVGIVLRGSAFVFRAYGLQPNEVRERWGRVFAWASAITPVFLGMTLAALSSGDIRVDASGLVTSGFFAGWTSPFALSVGLFALALCALLAAVYLASEADAEHEAELRDDFRRRALFSEAVAGLLAALVLWRAWIDAPLLFAGLLRASWSIPVQVATAAIAGGAILALQTRRLRLARVLVIIQVALVLLGWGLAMDGYLILPDMHLSRAGAEPSVLAVLPWVLLGGSLLFVPALLWLFRLFKGPSMRGPWWSVER
jgi:cytochrome d ubiquinol oxidase subunit II